MKTAQYDQEYENVGLVPGQYGQDVVRQPERPQSYLPYLAMGGAALLGGAGIRQFLKRRASQAGKGLTDAQHWTNAYEKHFPNAVDKHLEQVAPHLLPPKPTTAQRLDEFFKGSSIIRNLASFARGR